MMKIVIFVESVDGVVQITCGIDAEEMETANAREMLLAGKLLYPIRKMLTEFAEKEFEE